MLLMDGFEEHKICKILQIFTVLI